MGDKQLQEVLIISNDVADDLTDEQRGHAREDVNKIDEKAKDVSVKVKKTVKSLRAAADFLDEVWKKHNIAHAWGNGFGIIGGICSVLGGVAILTAGPATPLLVAGLSFGFTGAGTNIVAKIIEYVSNSKQIQQANKDLKEAYDSIAEMEELMEDRLATKEKSYLSYMYNFAAFYVSPSLRFLVLYLYRKGAVEITRQTVAKACGQAIVQGATAASLAGAQAAGKVGAEAASKAAAQAAGKVGAEAASKAGAQAAGKVGAEAASESVQGAVKASGQVADDVVGAGVKSGAQLAGKVIIAVSAVMLVLDVIDLHYTIEDLINKKGSGAAKHLREEADKLEERYIKKLKADQQ